MEFAAIVFRGIDRARERDEEGDDSDDEEKLVSAGRIAILSAMNTALVFLARAFLPACLCLAAAGCAPAAAQTFLNRERAQAVTDILDRDPLAVRAGNTCPAELYSRSRRSVGDEDESVSEMDCFKNPAVCHMRCTIFRSGEDCFQLARVFQDNSDIAAPKYVQTLFSMACAQGYAAGCTNRGAGLRNGGYDDDPLLGMNERAKNQCQFRTFRIACSGDDAWGCAMLGQAYANGEGIKRDAARARRVYWKSCGFGEKFAACRFSKRGLRDLRR